ncbi:cysteine hydrolase family protein [Bdellovibrionota bacterium]
MSDTALLIVDMLNDFLLPGASLEVEGGRKIIPAIQKKIEEARSRNFPIIFICDAHEEDDPEFKYWPGHAVKGTKGAEVVEELAPEPNDLLIPKPTLSSFYKTNLEEELNKRGIKRIILTGVCTNICIHYTAFDCVSRGFEVEIPEDCVAGLTEEDHRLALKQITEILKIAKKS